MSYENEIDANVIERLRPFFWSAVERYGRWRDNPRANANNPPRNEETS
jgi:hypothetical protein